MVTPWSQARRKWATAFRARSLETPPRYGSQDWAALPEGPTKWAAVVVAAERFARDDDLAELELAAQHRWLDALRADRIAEHQRMWTGRGFRPDPEIEADIRREHDEWIRGGELV